MATYVVPMSQAKTMALGALNLVVFLAMLTGAGVSIVGSGVQLSAGLWTIVALWLVAVTAICAWNLRQVRPKGEGR